MTWLLDIGDRLVRARRAVGLSQRELAERVGVRQQQIARWESEQYRCVSLARLNRVAEALGLTDAPAGGAVLVAEACGVYSASVTGHKERARPARDLGEVVARIRAHSKELNEGFGITRIAVFGSFARGEQSADSDVDVLVEFEEGSSPDDVLGAEERLESILARKVDMGSFQALRPRVRPYVRREAVDVWSARRGRAS